MSDFIVILKEEIETAQKDAADSHKLAMNSYGAGHDRGYADGLKFAMKYAEEYLD